MIYAYCCDHCEKDFDVVKAVVDYDKPEACPACNQQARRQFLPQRIHLYGTKVEEAEYNPGLGCIVKNKEHRKAICRQRGLEEIGSETPDAIHKHYDKAKAEKWERGWAEADKGWVGEG